MNQPRVHIHHIQLGINTENGKDLTDRVVNFLEFFNENTVVFCYFLITLKNNRIIKFFFLKFLPRQPTNLFTRNSRRSTMLLKLASMRSSVLHTILFSCCIRDAFSVLGMRTPKRSMLLSFNVLLVCSSVAVSIMSPFSFCAFPSENMTRIFSIED